MNISHVTPTNQPVGMGRDGFLNYIRNISTWHHQWPKYPESIMQSTPPMISGGASRNAFRFAPGSIRIPADDTRNGYLSRGIWAWHNTHVCVPYTPTASRSSRVLHLRFSICVISGKEKCQIKKKLLFFFKD